MYAAYAFALAEWVLFTVSFCYVALVIIRRLPSLPPIVEKEEDERAGETNVAPQTV